VRLTTSLPSCAECHEIWEAKPPGTLWATPGLLRDCFTHLGYTYSRLLLGYKPVQHVTVLNTVGNCNTMVSIVKLCCNIIIL